MDNYKLHITNYQLNRPLSSLTKLRLRGRFFSIRAIPKTKLFFAQEFFYKVIISHTTHIRNSFASYKIEPSILFPTALHTAVIPPTIPYEYLEILPVHFP